MLEPPPSIRPGFSVTADIITGTKTKVAAVPLAAVVVRDSQKRPPVFSSPPSQLVKRDWSFAQAWLGRALGAA